MELLEGAEAPSAGDYRAAARAFIRAERADLALEALRLREGTVHAPEPDPALSAGVLRACLRTRSDNKVRRDKRRNVAAGVQVALDALLRDAEAWLDSFADADVDAEADAEAEVKAPTLAPAPGPYATALAQVQVALLKHDELNNALRTLKLFGKYARRVGSIGVQLDEYNTLVRLYGKARRLDAVFAVMDAMRAASCEPDHETFEFLANSTVRSVDFVKGAVSMDTLPDPLAAEVAFCGRSNVGKSSLVNMLCNRRALAKVSGTPGKTQQFNYFIVNRESTEEPGAKAYYLVDLPGVGYAKVGKELRADWLEFMRRYFRHREQLRVVFHLVDGRHGALDDDIMLMRMLAEAQFDGVYVVILTKMDKLDKQKVKASVVNNVKVALCENGWPNKTPIVPTSAQTKLGRDQVWRYLQQALKSSVGTL